MLTSLKKIFIWWNQDTFGTRLKTIFFGKLIDSLFKLNLKNWG